jgi:hypothetical protein
MKTLKILAWASILFLALGSAVHAQQIVQKEGRYQVVTKLSETNGTYDERKLYRSFLTEAMKQCPYVSNFQIVEVSGSSDNHQVEWKYDVDGWEDITRFYNWIDKNLHSTNDSTFIKALTPYRPDYVLGGKITVHKKTKDEMVKN